MKRFAVGTCVLLFVATLVALFALPASSPAGERVRSVAVDEGGGSADTGGGGGGTASWNNVDFRGRKLDWKRSWSWKLMNQSLHDWCGDASNGYEDGGLTEQPIMPGRSETARKFVEAIPGSSPGDTWTWDGANPFARTGTCLSPWVKWTAASGGFNEKRWGEWGLDKSEALYRRADGKGKGYKPDCDNAENGKHIAWCILRDQVAGDVGIQNDCRVRPDVANIMKANLSGCPHGLSRLSGKWSDSEQIPKGPKSVDDVRIPGVPNHAILRVWRECPHDFPKTAAMGDYLEPTKPAAYDKTLSAADIAKCREPVLERVIPRVTQGPKDCPTAEAPYKASPAELFRVDYTCRTKRFFSYFWTERKPNGPNGWEASSSSSDGAFGSQGPRSRRESLSFSDPVAGALFGSCKNPPVGETRENADFCSDISNKGNSPVGGPEPGAPNNTGEGKSFTEFCENGPIAASKPWRAADYLGQLAYLAVPDYSTQASGGSRSTSTAVGGRFDWGVSLASRKPTGTPEEREKEKQDYLDDATEAFVRLFTFNNPILYNQAKFLGVPESKLKELGFHENFPGDGQDVRKNADGSWEKSNGWLPYSKGLEYIKFLTASGKPTNFQRKLDSMSPERRQKVLSCFLFSDWMRADWKVGGVNKDSNSFVEVAMNPRPNSMYMIQVTMLDSRENIVSESFQFAASPASGQLPAVKPPPVRECPSAEDVRLGRKPYRMYRWPLGTPMPPECTEIPPPPIDRGNQKANPLPIGSDFTTRQPVSQLSGQSWAFGDSRGFGRVEVGVQGEQTYKTLPDGSTPAGGESLGLWTPRAFRATIFNREDNAAGATEARYKKTHRVRALHDENEDTTESRFASSSNKLLAENNSIPSGVTSWLQGPLPLFYAPERSSVSPFYNEFSVAVSNPTRAPDENLDARAAQIAGLPSLDGLDEAQKERYRSIAAAQRKAEVDEHRLVTMVGESSGITSTQTKLRCPSIPNEPCEDVTPIKREWRRLTSDACPGPGSVYADPRLQRGDNPLTAVNNANPLNCDQNRDVGSGWKISDAYFLPAMGAQGKTELVSPFRADERDEGFPAHFVLDTPNGQLDKSSITNIAIWDRDTFMNRDGTTQPLYQVTNPQETRSLSICSKEDPIWETRYRTAYRKAADLPHRNVGWTRTVDGTPGHFALPAILPMSYYTDEYFDGAGGNIYAGQDGAWMGNGTFFNPPVTLDQAKALHRYYGITHFFAKEASVSLPLSGDQGFAYHHWTGSGWRTDLARPSAFGGVSAWGQPWWNGVQDAGPWEVWESYQQPYQVDVNPHTGQCTDEHSFSPNAQEPGRSGLMAKLPAGDYVISFSIKGPTGNVSRWGIDALTAQNEGTKWTNSFDLRQDEGLTSIFRYRPTG